MKKIITVLAILATFSSLHATDGDQMLGVTAMQWLRGGAVVASPVDAPSMLYNPAALGALRFDKMAFDLSLGVLNPPRKITSMIGTTESGSNSYLGMGNGFAVKVSDKLFFGMAAGGVAGLGVDFPSTTLPDNPGTPFPENTSVVTKKGLLKIVPTVAYNVSDDLALGLSLQIGHQSLALKTPGFIMPQTEMFGFGASVGAIYKISDQFQAGLSYVSKLDISEYEFNGTSPMAGEGVYKLDMDAPQNFAFGLAYTAFKGMRVEADVKWINFSDVMEKVELKTPTGGVIPLNFGWDDQIVYALGIDYAVMPGLCVKAGYNFGETPIGEEDVNNNLGAIAVVEQHFSIGLTKHLSNEMMGTLSYTHGLHNEVKSDTTPNIIEAEQNIVFLQFSYRL